MRRQVILQNEEKYLMHASKVKENKWRYIYIYSPALDICLEVTKVNLVRLGGPFFSPWLVGSPKKQGRVMTHEWITGKERIPPFFLGLLSRPIILSFLHCFFYDFLFFFKLIWKKNKIKWILEPNKNSRGF